MRIRRVAALTAISFFIGMPCANAGTPSLEFVTSWGGPVNAVQVVGDLVFAGSGRRLVALDANDLSNELGSIDLLSTVEDFVVREDGVAFVATGSPFLGFLGFCSVSVADPARMAVLDSHTVAGFFPGEVHLHDNLAYVEEHFGASEINVYDVTDPADLIHLGKPPLAAADEFELSGDRLYEAKKAIGGSGASFAIYDLASAPLSPPMLGQVVIPDCPGSNGDVSSLFISEPYAYLLADTDYCTGHDTLHIIDISFPSAPVVIGTYADLPGTSNDVQVIGGHAFVTSTPGPDSLPYWQQNSGTRVLDVTDPETPTLVGLFQTHGEVRAVRSSKGHHFLLDDGEGLVEVDLSNPVAPARLEHYHSPAILRYMEKSESLLYVVDAWNGFTILDVSNPDATPEVIGVYQTPIEPFDEYPGFDNWMVKVQGTKAYLSAGFGGLQVVDISDPAKPMFVDEFLPPSDETLECYRRAVALDLNGNYAYLAYEFSGCGGGCGSWLLRVHDLTKQGVDSTLMSGCQPPMEFKRAPGGILYAARGGALQIVNVQNPFTPFLITESEPPKFARAIDLADDHLMVAGDGLSTSDGAGCYVRDVTDADSPVTISYVPHSEASAIRTSGTRNYCVANYNPPGPPPTLTHLLMYNVEIPAAPVLLDFAPAGVVGNIDNQSDTTLLVDEPHAYVASGRSFSSNVNLGLEVFRVMGLPDPADLNGDGVVNGFDLAILLGAWGRCPKSGSCPADLNGNNVVNGFDLAILLGAWT